jgi:polar amino acid transport system substrate-binding protein
MQRVHRIIVLTLFLVSGLLASADTGAAQESPVLDRVVETGELRVGMSGSQPPFNVRDRSGDLIGIDVDVAAVLAAAMDAELNIVTLPFGELLNALEAGEVDMVISGMTITAERSQRVSFVGPYMLSGMSILTNSRSLSMIDETEDFDQANLKLAALRNSTSQRFIERHLPAAQFTAVEDYDAGVQMVLSDEVDALVADMPICLLTVLRFPDAGLLTLDAPLTIEPIGMAVPKGDMQFRNVVENYYRAMQGTGILEALREKWMEDGSWIAALP